jgi:hypothetical protein
MGFDELGESQHYRHGCRGAAGDITINGDHVRRPVRDRVASFIDAAVHGAVAAGQDQPRFRYREPGPLKGKLHLAGHGTGHEQYVGVARRCDEIDAEPLDIVDRVRERRAFPFAGVAGSRVNLTNPERPAEDCINLPLKVDNLRGLLRGDAEALGERDDLLFAENIFYDLFKHANSASK